MTVCCPVWIGTIQPGQPGSQNILRSCASSWFSLHGYIEMHGQQNITFIITVGSVTANAPVALGLYTTDVS